jgi:hypothetical protein
MVLFPVLSFPYTELLWLAFDLRFRPATADDLEPLASATRERGGERAGRSAAA